MNTISVYCYSYQDDLRTKKWPSNFTCRPIIGDHVKSTDGTIAQIISVCHSPEHYNQDGSVVLEVALRKIV